MIFLYNDNAGDDLLKLKGEDFKYIIKVRRHKVGDIINFRNEENPNTLYSYKIVDASSKEAVLELVETQQKEIKPKKYLHLAWCVVDFKSIEKVIASLNEIGVSKISFIYCRRSQKNFKIDYKRLKRILKASNQQCGRSVFMEFDEYNTLDEFLKTADDLVVLDFNSKNIKDMDEVKTVLVGSEGGFGKEEKEKLKKYKVAGFDSNLVLRSESAAVAVSGIILL